MYDDLDDEYGIRNSKEREEALKLRASLLGAEYKFEEVKYCIFENKTDFPHSLSFLCSIPCANRPEGLVYATNPSKNTYMERACKDRFTMDKIYQISKRKILTRTGLALCWEGRKLNDSKKS